MEDDIWMVLPIEAKMAIAEKRRQAAEKYQGSITCEKYGVYMTP